MVYGPRPSLVSAPKDSEVQVASASAEQPTAAAPQGVQEDPIDPVHQYLFNREDPTKRRQNPVEVGPGQALLSVSEDPNNTVPISPRPAPISVPKGSEVQVNSRVTVQPPAAAPQNAQPTAAAPQSAQQDPIDLSHQFLLHQ